MKHVCFVLMMLIAVTGTAAGLQELVNSFKKSTTTPQAPKPPAPKPPTGK